MPSDPLVLILLILGCVVFGFLFGAGLTFAWHRREKRAWAKKYAARAAEIPAPPVEQPAAPAAPPGPPPLAQLWRGETAPSLQVEMEGRRFVKASEMDAETRARTVNLLREWVTWLGFNQAAAPAPARPSAPAPAPRPAVQAKPAAAPAGAAPAIPAEGEVKPTSTTRSMVDQVDDILREMQADLPSNVERVKLRGDPQHGITVWIGLEHYDGIDNVPDEQARQLVKRAVAEWERRAG